MLSPQLRQALPWIIIFVIILLLLAFFGWIGYENWSELQT